MDLNTRFEQYMLHLITTEGLEYIFLPQAPDGSDAVLTVVNGRLDGMLNYNKPNKLFLIENCGTGDCDCD